ncbi:hypothetical protein [Streptomyces sp. NBC_00154]|nr:hypothetical protein [Streptomyces sp. NBC_00154]MCX5317029.1 hypothetical protein [Streptomyces sp. NBC_00154]
MPRTTAVVDYAQLATTMPTIARRHATATLRGPRGRVTDPV